LEIIHHLPLPEPDRGELLALAYVLGGRYLARGLLDALFRKDLRMVKGLGIIDDWIAEGEARCKADGARGVLLAVLRERFGQLPCDVVTRVEAADADWCQKLAPRVMSAASLSDLGL
jgi:hypothetical protein